MAEAQTRSHFIERRFWTEVKLPRSIWTQVVPDEWVEAFETEINAGRHGASWRRIVQYADDEHEVITALFQDSREPSQQDIKLPELRSSIRKTAKLIKASIASLPAEYQSLPEQLDSLSELLGKRPHSDNECARFSESILKVLTDPKIPSLLKKSHDFSGLPTVNDFIQIVQLALNTTDRDKREKRETRITEASLKAYVRRDKQFIESYLSTFRLASAEEFDAIKTYLEKFDTEYPSTKDLGTKTH